MGCADTRTELRANEDLTPDALIPESSSPRARRAGIERILSGRASAFLAPNGSRQPYLPDVGWETSGSVLLETDTRKVGT
jgi:hypothetical protein